ncbi:lasso peptide biosynthesis B2 protein [Roseateles sp.]|uniref:lasso peptide biosynthesis B2 protein n=1 Tax=Roseateles sp. TaxID=1971397 RepID=UPI002E0C7961|nr:lasso peptide biosynthesis B2 protein [Roseateles sp.]
MPTQASPLPEYRLADHVRACLVDGVVVLLDLERGRYIGVGGPLVCALSRAVGGWPARPSTGLPSAPDSEVERRVDDLRRQGLLASAATPASANATCMLPDASVYDASASISSALQWRRIANLARSSFIASGWLKHRSLATITQTVASMRPLRHRDDDRLPAEALRDAARWYLRTRPLVMSSRDECLHDSLTLLRFLAAEQLHPQWVIGVRMRPFAAHSWVQAGTLVLNDMHEHVRGFTPILVV